MEQKAETAAKRDTPAGEKSPPFSKKAVVIYLAVVAVFLCIIAVLLFATGTIGGKPVNIPKSITQRVKSPIYLPGRLPGNYKLDEGSFKVADEDPVLLFSAKDSAGSTLVFSEQSKPKNFSFEEFYKSQLKNAETLSNTPYSSVWGKLEDDRIALSIVTNDTWILMTSSAPISSADMTTIAMSIQKQ